MLEYLVFWLLFSVAAAAVASPSHDMSLATSSKVNNALPMQLAYNGSFVNTRLASNDKTDNQDYKIERGDSKGAKLIEHSLSLLIKDLKAATDKKKRQAVMEKANADQQHVYFIYDFRKNMEKGGFQAYFRSDAGSDMAELKKALIAIKANQYLLVLNKAIKAFADDPHVLDDTFGRNQVLDEMDEFDRFSFFEEVDAEYRSLEDDDLLVDRVAKYLNEHAKKFFAQAE